MCDQVRSVQTWSSFTAKWRSLEDGVIQEWSVVPGITAVVVPHVPRRSGQRFIVTLHVDEAWVDPPSNEDTHGQPLQTWAVRQAANENVSTQSERQKLCQALAWMLKDLVSQEGNTDEVDSLSVELGYSYEIINLLLRLGERMNVAQEPSEFIESVCQELRETVGFRWVGSRLLPGALDGKSNGGGLIAVGDTEVHRRALIQRTTELLVTREIAGARVIETADNSEDNGEFADLGDQILVHSLKRGERVIGGLFACDKVDTNLSMDSGDIRVLEATAAHLQIFLDNAALYDDIRLMFMGTLEALTASIDAKDPYTCGHSERVAYLSQSLAAALGLETRVVERVQIAGLVHDVGKIGVPEAILRKPGRLTDDEFDAIKLHPEIGARILRDIPNFEDVLPGVLFHHERVDGNGYPRGLEGDDIPLFGRIIAIADSFDAMSSTRQYRRAMPRSKVLDELRKGAGTQFDANLVPIFLQLDLAEYDRMVEAHSAAEGIERSEAA